MSRFEQDCGADGIPRSQLEAELLVERGRNRLLSAHTHGIIFEFNAAGRFVRVWSSDPDLLAKPEEELIGLTVSEALGVELGAFHDEAVRRALSTGSGDEYEYTLDVPSGRRSFMATSVVVPAVNSDEQAVVYWIRDVTERVQAKARELHNEHLATIGRLAAGVAHEINNPLAYISLNLEGIERRLNALRARPSAGTEEDFEDIAVSLGMIREGSTRVQKIVRDLLNFSRLDDPLTRVDVIRAVSLAMELVLTENHPDVTVVRKLGPTPLVLADEGRLIQVFVNLLQNAVQALEAKPASGHGSGKIYVTTRTNAQGWAEIEIRDTGCGIQKPLFGRIFEPFYTTKPHGVGLGLALCQNLVSSFAGHIEVSSEPGRGSTFLVAFPA